MNGAKSICLVVIYNHNFEKNIPVIRRMYNGRFSNVIQIMPFYRGKDEDVVGVYEASYQFNGYLAQASARILAMNADYNIVVADDMILNPELNENNIIDKLGIRANEAVTTNFSLMTDDHLFSYQVGRSGLMFLEGINNVCQWRHFMPSPQKARIKFEIHGLDWRQGVSMKLLRLLGSGLRAMRLNPWMLTILPPLGLLRRFLRFFAQNRESLPIDTDKLVYPTAWGYSDFLVIPKIGTEDFFHYCGVLASARQWVESAIPTALLLAYDKVCTVDQLGWKCEAGVYDYSVRERIEKASECSYPKLIKNFPADYLFIHPIKLSKWKDLP